MQYEQINYEFEDKILTITLNRPDKLNAFTDKMRDELIDAIDNADADDNVKAIIFTGASRGFCTGKMAYRLTPSISRSVTLVGSTNKKAHTEVSAFDHAQ